MTKQLLIYERVVPLESDTHADISLTERNNYKFARKLNSVPLLSIEFLQAALDHPIVFAKNNENIFPAAILSLRPDRNEHISYDGQWGESYIPAFFRRYPFIFTNNEDADDDNYILAIDEASHAINRRGEGEPLFDKNGNRTAFLQGCLDFTAGYQKQYNQTQFLCKHLAGLGLFEDTVANFSYWSGQPGNLSGFCIINRQRLAELDEENVRDLLNKGVLEIIFAHLSSLYHLERLSILAAHEGGPQLPPRETNQNSNLPEDAAKLYEDLKIITNQPPLIARSRKINVAKSSESRVLFTFNSQAFDPKTGQKDVAKIFDDTLPDEFQRLWGEAQSIHFGIDADDPLRGSVRKCYIEFPLGAGPIEDLVYLAHKVGNTKHVHRYERIVDPTSLIMQICHSPELHDIVKIIAAHASLLLRVSEDASERLSLDMNLADRPPTPAVIAAIDRLIQLIDPIAEATRHWPSHVAIGRSADGSLFITLYGWPDAECP